MFKHNDESRRYMLQRNSSILWRELAGEAVLLNPAEGCSYNLNAVGTVIWKLLDGNHSPEAIAQVVYEQYEVEPEQALEDVRHLLAEFQANKLVHEASVASHPIA